MRILLITPIIKEYHAAREVFGAKEVVHDPSEKYRSSVFSSAKGKIVIVLTGIGRRNVFHSLDACALREIDLVIDSGSCGSLRDDLSVGDILYSSIAYDYQGNILHSAENSVFSDYRMTSRQGSILEVESPVENRDIRAGLNRAFNCDACTMETYSVAEWAQSHRLDWISLRIVTDNADEQTPKEFKRNIRKYSIKLYNSIKRHLLSGLQK